MSGRSEREQMVRALLEQHHMPVYRTLLRFGLDKDRAHDAALEVFVVASNKLELIQPGKERSFLLSTAVRIASNFRRASFLRHEVQSEHAIEAHVDPLPAQDQLYYQRQLRRKLNEILERLPEDLRTAFVLFEFEGLSVPEIANATNTKLGTVSSRLRRARELFQQGVKRLRTQGLIEGESA